MNYSKPAFVAPSVPSITSFTSSFAPAHSKHHQRHRHQLFTSQVATRRPRRPANIIKCSSANINGSPYLISQPFDRSSNRDLTIPQPGNRSALGPNDLRPVRIFGRTWYISGKLLLIFTPFLWGGYTVSVRLLYTLPWAISPAVFNVARLLIAALIVFPGLLAHRRKYNNSQQKAKENEDKKTKSWLNLPEVKGGVEIGLWTFFVNILQIAGLKYSSASRASFICQLNSIIVPFAAFAMGMESSIGLPVYLASILSVIGVALFSLDDFAAPFTLLGEGVLLISALAGAAFVLRCKTHSAHKDPSVVIGIKICAQFFFSLLFAVPTIFKRFSPHILSLAQMKMAFLALFHGATPWLILINVLLVLYNGIFISWLSSITHFHGQNAVSASEAAVIFASTPIWSAALAIPLGERFGLRGIMGAALIVCATLLSSSKRREDTNPTQTDPLKMGQLKQMNA